MVIFHFAFPPTSPSWKSPHRHHRCCTGSCYPGDVCCCCCSFAYASYAFCSSCCASYVSCVSSSWTRNQPPMLNHSPMCPPPSWTFCVSFWADARLPNHLQHQQQRCHPSWTFYYDCACGFCPSFCPSPPLAPQRWTCCAAVSPCPLVRCVASLRRVVDSLAIRVIVANRRVRVLNSWDRDSSVNSSHPHVASIVVVRRRPTLIVGINRIPNRVNPWLDHAISSRSVWHAPVPAAPARCLDVSSSSAASVQCPDVAVVVAAAPVHDQRSVVAVAVVVEASEVAVAPLRGKRNRNSAGVPVPLQRVAPSSLLVRLSTPLISVGKSRQCSRRHSSSRCANSSLIRRRSRWRRRSRSRSRNHSQCTAVLPACRVLRRRSLSRMSAASLPPHQRKLGITVKAAAPIAALMTAMTVTMRISSSSRSCNNNNSKSVNIIVARRHPQRV